jgi:hypothetical protein
MLEELGEPAYETHAFRPIVGNSVFCSACPAGSSFGVTHPWHVGHEPISLETVVAEAELARERDEDLAEAARQARLRADENERLRNESIEKSDTDGFVSQWAHGVSADRDRLQATILEEGGLAKFDALFNEKGEYVPAYFNRGRFGRYWKIIETGETVTFGSKRKLAGLGLTEGVALFPAEAFIDGEGTGLSGRAWASYQKTVRETVPPTSVVTLDRRS